MFHRLFAGQRKTGSWLTLALLSATCLDEIVSGFPTIGLPLIRDQFHLDYASIGLLFSITELVSTFLSKPVIGLLSDQGSRRYWIVGGLVVLAASFLLAGSSNHFAVLLLAFILIHMGGEAAQGGAQSTLIDQHPLDTVRAMARWTMAGGVGDVLAPLAVTLLVGLHLGWPALCWLAASMWLGLALFMGMQRFPASQHSEQAETRTPLLATMRTALHDRVFLSWAALSLIPTMMDEIFIGFATLYLHDVLHASEVVIGLLVADLTISALLSLLVIERWLLRRIAPAHLLAWLSVLVLIGMILFLSTRSLWLIALALFLIGTGVTGWYPIAKGQAYARVPGRPGLVRTFIGLGGPFEIALPGIVGLIAGKSGIWAGVATLGIAPLLVLLLLPGTRAQH
jgi:predicted MFS family arabinose efflux permease